MMEIVSHIAANEVPVTNKSPNMSGVALRSKIPHTQAIENLKNLAASGCPVNKKIPTRMTRKSFIAACKAFKEVADKDKDNKKKYVISTPQGFRTNNRRVCVNCKIGEAIAEGKPFKKPSHITFIELTDLKGRPMLKDQPKKPKPKKKKSSNKIKLTKEDVIRIRKMHKEGYSVPGLCQIFPVTSSTMYRVVNYESWKDVK